jgi:hypothetical protein
MKLLFTAIDRAQLTLLQGLLEDAGIQHDVRNEFTSANYPPIPYTPELWVIHDEDFAKAVELRDSLCGSTGSAAQDCWTCPKCGERLEGQFSSCWKCGTSRAQTPGPVLS